MFRSKFYLTDGFDRYLLLRREAFTSGAGQRVAPGVARRALRECLHHLKGDRQRLIELLGEVLGWSERSATQGLLRRGAEDHLERVLESGAWILLRREPNPGGVARKRERIEAFEGEVADRSAWIEIQLVDERGEPVSGVPYEIELSDHRTSRGSTNTAGVVRFDGIPDGSCSFSLTRLDASAWEGLGGAASAMGQHKSGLPATDYTVRQGDCIATVAAIHGFLWSTIWEDGGNASLRSERENPNILAPGDSVHVPEQVQKLVDLPTSQIHRFRVLNQTVKLVFRLTGSLEPLAEEDWVLEVGRETITGTTGGDGKIEAVVPARAREGTLTLPSRRQRYQLRIGDMDPGSTTRGVQKRLHNMSLYEGPLDDREEGEALRRSLRLVQQVEGLDRSGEIDGATRSKITDLHAS